MKALPATNDSGYATYYTGTGTSGVSDPTLLHILIVDRSLTDIERITQLLRGAGYVVQIHHADNEPAIRELLGLESPDLALVRVSPDLPSVKAVVSQLKQAGTDTPVIAVVDDEQYKAVEFLRSGADNVAVFGNPEHLVLVASKEMRQSRQLRAARDSQQRLKELEARSRVLLDSARDAIAYIHEGAHIYANPAYLKLFGYSSEGDLEGVTLLNMVTREDRDTLKAYLRKTTKAGVALEPVELHGLHSNGNTSFPVHLSCLPTRINEEPCLQVAFHVPQAEGVAAVTPNTQIDPATGLMNRRAFIETLNSLRGNEASGAVLYILLTDYRANAEKLGLEAIDQLVVDLAHSIRSALGEHDQLAHFSDAVFTVYSPNASRSSMMSLAEKVRDTIREHVSHVAQKLVTSACAVGLAPMTAEHSSAFQLLGQADRACEEARQAGKNEVRMYTPPRVDDGTSAAEAKMLKLVADAIRAERMELWYQPIASFEDTTTERYQVVLHLLDEERKPMQPGDYLEVATKRNLMYPLEKWMIVRSLEQLTLRFQQSHKTATLFLPVTGNTLAAKDFKTWVEGKLRDTGLPGSSVVFEVSEEVVEPYFKEAQRMREEMRGLGCGFALAHFGGKPHSERLLRHLKPDCIKIDCDLIDRLTSARDTSLKEGLAHLTSVAQEMHVHVVAADITTAPQMASIWQFGVGLVQGSMVQEPSREMGFDFAQFAA